MITEDLGWIRSNEPKGKGSIIYYHYPEPASCQSLTEHIFDRTIIAAFIGVKHSIIMIFVQHIAPTSGGQAVLFRNSLMLG